MKIFPNVPMELITVLMTQNVANWKDLLNASVMLDSKVTVLPVVISMNVLSVLITVI